MKKILTVLLFVGFASIASAQSGIDFESKAWKEVVAKAKTENKLIFMDAYTSWCGPCKLLQKKVFPDATLGSYFNENFINFKVDMEKGEGPVLASKYPVRGYPTLLFIDPNTEKIVQSVLGYRSADQLLNIGKSSLAKSKS